MVIMFDIETTGLRPFDCVVTLIGLKNKGEIQHWKLWEIKDEAKMIIGAIEELRKVNETIVGYNNLKFDVPFMIERLRILGKWQQNFYEIYFKKWFDLYQYLGNDYRSLVTWLSVSEIERDHPELDGRDMPKYFEKEEYEKIEQHNNDDLNTSEKLFQFLKTKNPELIPFE